MSHRMSNAIVLNGINRKLLSPASRRAIIACARRSLGEHRDRRGIIAIAKELGAEPRVVLAAFGFLPDLRNARRYVDVLMADEFTVAVLPEGTEVAAAFALSRALHPNGCTLCSSPSDIT